MKPVPTTKRCSRCGRELPFDDFYFLKKKCMFSSMCRECSRIQKKEWYLHRQGRTEPLQNCYSSEEIQYIKTHYMTDQYKDIAKTLGRSYSSVANKINKLGLTKVNHEAKKRK